MLGDMGLKCESSHFSMTELRENLADRIAWAQRSRIDANDGAQPEWSAAADDG